MPFAPTRIPDNNCAFDEDGDGKCENHFFLVTRRTMRTIATIRTATPTRQQALMKGAHAARTEPEPGKTYAFLVDGTGQDEARTTGEEFLQNPGRDSTNLKIVEIDMSTVPILGKPAYCVVFRKEWSGEKHVTVFGALRALAQTWRPMKIVMDATGVDRASGR
jgi:hypothetical protein